MLAYAAAFKQVLQCTGDIWIERWVNGYVTQALSFSQGLCDFDQEK